MSRGAPSSPSLPFWPALLTTELACLYVQLSEGRFRMMARRHGVEPRDCDGFSVTRWRRSDLDRLIDSLPARGAEMHLGAHANDLPAADPAGEALARAERRAKG